MSKRKRMSDNNLVVIISGPTGVGKSDVAAQLCKRLDGIIVSADSVQAYRGVQIGANKPSAEERDETPHLLIDVVEDSSQTYNAADWQQDALYCMERLLLLDNDGDDHASAPASTAPHQESIQAEIDKARRTKGYKTDQPLVPIIVGGTMMYLQWLVHGRPDVSRPTEEATQRANAKIQKYRHQNDWLGAKAHISSLGPAFASRVKSISNSDWYRLRRTLEIAYTCGDDAGLMEKLYSGERQGGLESLGYDVRCFFLCPTDRMEHTAVVDRRCEEMIQRGLLQETADLVLNNELPEMARRAIGYRQTVDYLKRENVSDKDTDAFESYLNDFTTATRRYAKKQMQWFRRDKSFVFVPVILSDSQASRVSATTDMIERLCLSSREEFHKESLPIWDDGTVPLSERTKRANEQQGKGMKFYQFKRYILKQGTSEYEEALDEADDCSTRLLPASGEILVDKPSEIGQED